MRSDASAAKKGSRCLQRDVMLWPTATATDAKASGSRAGTPRSSSAAKAHPGTSLTDAVLGMWATPTRRDWKGTYVTLVRKDGKRRLDLLPDQVALWPTPTACTYGTRNNGDPGDGRAEYATKGAPGLAMLCRQLGRPDQGPPSTSKSPRGLLNCRWVATLMGYPPDWCDVPTAKG
jgi:hypothetical protein